MATKKEATAALKLKRGNLVEESTDDAWIVFLEAPVGRVWSDYGSHKKSIFADITDNKAQFWESVIDDIEALGLAIPCDVHSCVEWDVTEGHCEYWHDMVRGDEH